MENRSRIKKFSNFLFLIVKDKSSFSVLSRIRLIVIYIISLTGIFIALPYGLYFLPAGPVFIKTAFFISTFLFISASVVFLLTRNLYTAQWIVAAGIVIFAAEEIIDLNISPGWGPLVVFSIIPVFYLLFEFRIAIFLPVLLSGGTLIRLASGSFTENSLYLIPEYRVSFGAIIIIAGIFSTITILCIRIVIKHLINLAFTDQITGIPNRSRFQQLLKIKCYSNRQTEKNFSIIGIEILNFNNLNSNIGTENCDLILNEVSERISIFSSDITGRWSGSVFILSTAIYSTDALMEFCKSVLNILSEVYIINNRQVYVSFVLAVSRFPEDGNTSEKITSNLISLLDRKTRAAGDILFHDNSTIQKEQYMYRLTEALNSADFDREFSIEYQPKISIHDGKYRSAEALLRWVSPELGFISPGDFIPAAEDSGIIRKLTQWVIKRVLTDRVSFTDAYNDLIFALNLSIMDLKDSSFIPYLSKALISTGCNPSFIEFEITERFQLDNDPQVINNIRDLYETGFRIAIDDFGTGYSNLSYLQKLEINNLKIDKSFIDEISEAADRPNYPIIDTIITLGNSIGAEITAEGVENNFQLDYLKNKNCSTVQGWLFAKSMPLEKLKKFLKGE